MRINELSLLLTYLIGHILCTFGHFEITVQDEKPQGLTCWTCPNMESNQECNDWAPDVPCPQNKTTCMTVHTFDQVNLRSVSVLKKCIFAHECDLLTVGCYNRTEYMECIYCCSTSYCNKNVPMNEESAVKMSSFSSDSTKSVSTICTIAVAVFVIMVI